MGGRPNKAHANGSTTRRSETVMPPKPVMLVILDGFGWREASADNAVRLADNSNFNALWSNRSARLPAGLRARCRLPDGQMGNSEVGHLTIGSGRVIKQELVRIGDAVHDGSIAKIPAFVTLVEALRKSGGTCHLMGLVSPGGVHSHQDHAAGLAGHLSKAGVKTVVHAFTDGRDTPPQSAGDDLAKLRRRVAEGCHNRHGDRSLLCHGPGQAVGSRGRRRITR